MIRRGFTLIELLVVITILAILAGAALPYVQSYVAESRIAKAKTDLEEIARALAVYETREGEYPDTGTGAAAADGLSDVSQLTGRYLNKAPIDPWGKPYVIDLNAGTVYSSGPDRASVAAADKYDDISVPYQPPLALVSVKWVDKNQSGAVDVQNVSDQVQLTFSRKLNNTSSDFNDNNILEAMVNGATKTIDQLVTLASAKVVNSSRTVVYDISGADVFTAGQDSIYVKSNHNKIIDQATPDPNYCISDQPVKILPQ